jgi:hypothetical protein
MLTSVIVPMTGTLNMVSMIRVGSKATASFIHAAIAMYGVDGRARWMPWTMCHRRNRWSGALGPCFASNLVRQRLNEFPPHGQLRRSTSKIGETKDSFLY